jgi:hypothetical protein
VAETGTLPLDSRYEVKSESYESEGEGCSKDSETEVSSASAMAIYIGPLPISRTLSKRKDLEMDL